MHCDDEDNDDEWEDVEEAASSDDEGASSDALGLDQCVFCPQVSRSLGANLRHMTVAHSFFIPDIEYLVDLEGLMTYLGQKVGDLHMCLWCSDRSRLFADVKSVKQHMIDKSHCRILHEGDAMLEYADFYDYRSSYPDYAEKKAGDAAAGTDVEMKEAADSDDEIGSLKSAELSENGYQLALPSGNTAGHRSLQLYYRQNLKMGRDLVVARNNSLSVSKVITHYKSLGWLGTTGAAAQQKAKDIAYLNRMRSRYMVNVGVKSNKLQRHFRDDNFGI